MKKLRVLLMAAIAVAGLPSQSQTAQGQQA